MTRPAKLLPRQELQLDDVQTYLKHITNFRKGNKPEGYKYYCFEEYVLHNGKVYKPKKLLKKYRRGKLKECFTNAFFLAQRWQDELTYVEGYALSIIPILHAWCVDNKGNVIDNTWEEPGHSYFGVPFKWQYVFDTVLKKGTYGVIDNFEQRFPLLKGD